MPRTRATLGLEDARRMVGAGEASATTLGLPYCVAVVDSGGHLLAFTRQDGALIGSIDLAINKARTAMLFEKPTALLHQLAEPAADLYGIQNSHGGQVVLIGGGLPVLLDGLAIGAVGASAGTVAQDIIVAEAALASVVNGH